MINLYTELKEMNNFELADIDGGDWIYDAGVAVGKYYCWVKNNYGKYIVSLDNSMI